MLKQFSVKIYSAQFFLLLSNGPCVMSFNDVIFSVDDEGIVKRCTVFLSADAAPFSCIA